MTARVAYRNQRIVIGVDKDVGLCAQRDPEAGSQHIARRIYAAHDKWRAIGCRDIDQPLVAGQLAAVAEAEKSQAGNARYVFFGLRSDIEVAHYLSELIDSTIRSELGRYKTSPAYRSFRHQDRHMANTSFNLGMVSSIADKLTAMKKERDAVKNGTGRDLFVLKASVVDAELERLDLNLRTVLQNDTVSLRIPAL